MRAADYFIAYVQGDTPRHYLTQEKRRGAYEKVPAFGAADAKGIAEWALSETAKRWRGDGAHAALLDAKRAVMTRENAVAPHVHRACWDEVSAAFDRPMLAEQDVAEWFYHQEVEPAVGLVPGRETVEVGL